MKVFLCLTSLLAVAPPPVAWCDELLAEGDDEGDDEGHDSDDDDYKDDSLSAEQLQRLHAHLDGDGDGRVSLKEILKYAATTGVRNEIQFIGVMLEEVDKNNDGKISLKEHLKEGYRYEPRKGRYVQERETPRRALDMKELAALQEVETAKFKAADSDGDMLLDHGELFGLWHPATHEGVLKVIVTESMRQKDVDEDGQLSPKEFWENEAAYGSDLELSDKKKEKDFQKLDKDGNGFLESAELQDWETGRFHREDAMQGLFDIADKDNDTHITAEEMAAATDEIADSDAHEHLSDWAEHHEL